MTSIITLALFKAHIGSDSQLDPDAFGILGTATDELLQLYIDMAEARASAMLGKSLNDFDPLPGDIKGAILQIAAHHYWSREAHLGGTFSDDLPEDATNVLRNYRVEVTGYVRPE